MYEVRCNDFVIAKMVKEANSFISRGVGLMFIKEMKSFDGLLIKPSNSIHTCFMQFNLDIIFLNSENKIIKIIRNMKPWRMTRMYFKASKVLELNAGVIDENLKEGDYLTFKEALCIN